jgi:hypothetical protein
LNNQVLAMVGLTAAGPGTRTCPAPAARAEKVRVDPHIVTGRLPSFQSSVGKSAPGRSAGQT